jgi:radical SAM superfamily enzyme YgiQ (UPF0313 family)
MKVLLINAPIPGFSLKKSTSIIEPLGLAYLAAYIRKKHEVKLVDAYALRLGWENVEKEIKKFSPDIVGVTGNTPNISQALKTLEIAKKVDETIRTVIGGCHVTALPDETMQNPYVDIGVIGEGEITFSEICDKKPLKQINGLVFKKNNKIIRTKNRELIKNIDEIPFPARDLLPMKKYKPATPYRVKAPQYNVITSRGCPFNCIFCSKIFGNVWRPRTPKNVVKEVLELKNCYNTKSIGLIDETFTIDEKRVLKLCDELKKKVGLPWACMGRVDMVNKKILHAMKNAGCESISYGIESGSQKSLDKMKKGITIKQIRKAVRRTKEVGISVRGFFIGGFFWEKKEDLDETIRFAKNLELDNYNFHILQPYPGSEVYKQIIKERRMLKMNWEESWRVPFKEKNYIKLDYLNEKDLRRFYLKGILCTNLSYNSIKWHLKNLVPVLKDVLSAFK